MLPMATEAVASGCAILTDDGKDDGSDSEPTLPLGGKEATPALELTLVLALRRIARTLPNGDRTEEAEDAFKCVEKIVQPFVSVYVNPFHASRPVVWSARFF